MTSTPSVPPPPTEHTLLGTTDASEWAREFCRIFQGKTIGGPVVRAQVDEGTMLAWFASAIETGRSAGSAEWTVTDAEEAEEVDEDDVEEEDEPADEPTLEEHFKEGFDEGRA